jgi:hypothetical protein
MAAAFVADQAAAVATFGLAEAAAPVIVESAERLVKSLVMDLEQYVIGRVIGAAAEPLFAKVDSATAGLDWAGSGGGGDDAGRQISVDPAEARAQLTVLRHQAAAMRSHGKQFAAAVGALGF